VLVVASLRGRRELLRLGTLPFFSSFLCRGVFGHGVAAGDKQPRSLRWVSRPAGVVAYPRRVPRWQRLVLAEWCCFGVGRILGQPASCGSAAGTEGPDIGTPPRRSRWFADLMMRALFFGAGWGVEPIDILSFGRAPGGVECDFRLFWLGVPGHLPPPCLALCHWGPLLDDFASLSFGGAALRRPSSTDSGGPIPFGV
jgi:hypothetical protein